MTTQRARRHARTWIVLACCLVALLLAAVGREPERPRAAHPRADESPAALRLAGAGPAQPAAARASAGPADWALGLGAGDPLAEERDEPVEGSGPYPGERGATDAHAAFLALGRRSPEGLDARAGEILTAATPAATRLAFVRACLELRTAHRLESAQALLRPKTDPSTPKDESLAQAVVRFLGDAAEEDPEARNMVRRIAFEELPIASQVRVRAAQAFARTAAGRDLEALRRHLAVETDSRLIAGALDGLAKNPDASAARRVAHELGLALPARDEDLQP